jgi:uncharacterized membrane protein YfcA
VIGIPERPLNACIALSIVFVAVDIVRDRRGKARLRARYPWAVAGGFGLVHGIGFATALAGLGLERALLPVALLFFNVGVEIGQFAVRGAGFDAHGRAATAGCPPARSPG